MKGGNEARKRKSSAKNRDQDSDGTPLLEDRKDVSSLATLIFLSGLFFGRKVTTKRTMRADYVGNQGRKIRDWECFPQNCRNLFS